MTPSHTKSEFEKLLKRDYFSQELHPIRKEAFAKFMANGFPTQTWEDWRFTNLTSIKNGSFSISELKDAPDSAVSLEPYTLDGVDTVVFVNGHYQENISSTPQGVTVLTGFEYMQTYNRPFETPENTPFDLLNSAFIDSGLCFVVEKNTVVERPLRILFLSDGSDSIMIHPRLHIDVCESSQLMLIEQHAGNATSYYQNESVFIQLDKNAKLHHIRSQSQSDSTQSMTNLHVKQRADSFYKFCQLIEGSQLERNNVFIDLNESNAECSYHSLALTKHSQHIDNNITINHNYPNTHSAQFVKTILFDSSSGVFNGKTIVQKDAQKITAHQSNKNLLLSKKARMNANPQLEIYADDVKCSHGSSTGEIDEDALFYIQSRGIGRDDAIKLVVNGFAKEIIDNVKHENIHAFLQSKIDKLLKEMVK
jgi:Fe-S cluster assembly protein SufD